MKNRTKFALKRISLRTKYDYLFIDIIGMSHETMRHEVGA